MAQSLRSVPSPLSSDRGTLASGAIGQVTNCGSMIAVAIAVLVEPLLKFTVHPPAATLSSDSLGDIDEHQGPCAAH